MKPVSHPLVWIVLLCAAITAAVVGFRTVLPPKLAVVHPMRGPAVEAVYATGTVESTIMLPIAARISARLLELRVDEGSQVHKGDLLGRLEDTDLRNAVAQLRSQEAFAKNDYDRNSALVKTGLVARAAFDKSRSDYLAARAATSKASAELDYAKLVAPADGRIIHRDGEIGELIPVNQPVFWLSVESPLRISAEVDEEDIARIQPDQEVLIRADAFPDRVFHGTVQSITPKGDPVARSYRVRVGLSETTPLLIGMTAETNIVIRKDEHALLLPPSAISGDKVWVVANGLLRSQPVTVGASSKESVEIRSGVDAGDLVVLAPDKSLRVGARARVESNSPPR